MAGLGVPERRRVPAEAEAPPARAPTPRPFVRSEPGVSPTWGAEWGTEARVAGGQARGRRARPACSVRHSARAPGRAGERAASVPDQAHCSAGPGPAGRGQGSKSGRRPSRGRRTPGESETSCRRFCFLFKNAPWTRGGCSPNPRARRGRPGGCGRRCGPASGAFPATCQFYCCRASESLRISPRRRSARWTSNRPSPAPRDPRPGRAPSAELRAAARGRGRRGGKRDPLGNLRERRRVAGVAASLRAAPRNAWIHRPGAGSRLSPPARTAGVPSWVLKVSPVLLVFTYAPLHPLDVISLSLVLPLS